MNPPAPVRGECNALRFWAESSFPQLRGVWVRCTELPGHDGYHRAAVGGVCCAWDRDEDEDESLGYAVKLVEEP